jgi:O-antigen/teichoic acid export membrane protein
VFRDILKKTSAYSLAIIGGRAVSLLMLPLYTRYLTPSDYGVMELLDLTVSLVGMLLGTRVGQSLFYFYFAATTEKDRDKCISSAFLGAILLGATSALILVPASVVLSRLVFGSTQYAPYFRLVFISFAFSLPVEIGYSCMRMLGRSGAYARATLWNLAASVALNVLFLVVFHLGIKSMLLSGVLAAAGLTAYMTWYTLRPVGISLDFRLLVRFLKYSVPLSLGGFALFFVHYGDRAFLKSYVSLGELGIYSLGYKIGMLITFLYAPFALHWNAQVASIVRKPGSERTYVRTMTYLTAALTFAVVLLTLFVEPLLRLLVSSSFQSAASFVPWIAVAYLMRAVGAHLQGIFTAEGRPGLEAKVNIVGSVACVAAYALLIPRFRVWGAIAATVFGFFVILVYSFREAQRVRHFHFEYDRLLRIAVPAIAVVGIFYLVRPAGFWIQLGLAVLLQASYVLILLFGCFDREDRDSAAAVLGAIRKKLFSRNVPAEVMA